MGQLQVQDLLHLTSVNPYIVGSLQPARGQSSGKGLHAHLPREVSAASNLNHGSIWGQVAGVSGFAFQGTNAHVVLGRCALLIGCSLHLYAQVFWAVSCLLSRPPAPARMSDLETQLDQAVTSEQLLVCGLLGDALT